MIYIKTKEDIEKIREGGKILADVLMQAKKIIKVGTTSAEVDKFVHDFIVKAGAYPAFLNYKPEGATRPFPASLCICVNDQIVHGVPTENIKTFKEGDIITLDCGVKYKDLYTDHAITFVLGKNENSDIKKLLQKNEEALYAGIKQAKIGNRVGDIGFAIQSVAKENGLTVIKELTGHGVGYKIHEDPYVPNYGKPGEGELLKEGMVIAIEPMFSLGSDKIVIEDDDWTLSTKDGSMSAQFEHTVAITENGPVILTR